MSVSNRESQQIEPVRWEVGPCMCERIHVNQCEFCKLDVFGGLTTMGTMVENMVKSSQTVSEFADNKQQAVVMSHSGQMAQQNIYYSLVTEIDGKTFKQCWHFG